jgi:dUTP pyrophosphatase
MILSIKKLYNDVISPKYGSAFAAGLDLCAYGEYTIEPHTRLVISTGICIEWNGSEANNYYLRIAPRSGLSVKNSIDVGAGVIDYDYRGPIKVILFNFSDEDFIVKKHDKIAQLILEKINRPNIELGEQLDNTERGSNGFGSSGR